MPKIGRKLTEVREIGLQSLFTAEREGAKETGVRFELSFKDYSEIAMRRCIFCNSRGNRAITTQFKVTSVEPLYDTQGFVPGNAIPVCFYCSKIRQKLEWSTLKLTIKICRKLEKMRRA